MNTFIFLEKNGVLVVEYGKKARLGPLVFSYFNFVNKKLLEYKPDIFWEVNAIIPKKLAGKQKNVITLHDMFPITNSKEVGRLYSLYFRWFLKKTLAQTDYIIYNSKETKINTNKIYKKTRKIKSFISYVIVKRKKKEVCKNGEYFLYLGNLEKRKGSDILLNAYDMYVKMGGKAPLFIAGKVKEEEINLLLKKMIRKHKGIKYLNYVSEEKKEELYKNCACFLFPSKAEGFGMPIVEVMQYKKPVIASNLSIFDELVGDCINKFNLYKDDKKTTKSLALKLFSYEKDVDVKKYENVCKRYDEKHLTKRMMKFLDSISKEK